MGTTDVVTRFVIGLVIFALLIVIVMLAQGIGEIAGHGLREMLVR